MNPARLLEHFDRISDAPDAIPRLRRFILDLAVRGKLVEQDPHDEPASDLLDRIQAEKARLMKLGEVRKQRSLPCVEEQEEPFSTPTGWQWARIRQVTSDRGQRAPDEEFTYIDVTAINKEAGCIGDVKVLSASDAPSRARKLVGRGDVLYSCVRPYLLNIAVVDADIVPHPIASTAFAVLNGFGLVLPRYLWVALRSPFMVDCVEAKMRGQAYPAINDSDFALLPIPLPPLNEQHRIVAKVHELMALCDRLEAAQSERERRRDLLTAASLHRLNAQADTSAFRCNADFHLRHLVRVTTTRPDQLPALRQSILALAFQGKFTSPHEGESLGESARDHLERLLFLRTQFWAARTSRSSRKCPEPAVHQSVSLPSIPKSWVWTSADALCAQITDGEHIQPRYQNEGFPMLSAKHVRDGYVTLKDAPLIAESDFEKALQRCSPENGDILVVSVGATTGRAAIVRDCPRFSIVRSVLLLKPLIWTEYLLRWLQTSWCLSWMAQASGASAQPHLYIRDIREMPVPLPPLAEQHRIVAKVDELMALCDRLEAQLTTAQTESRRLLESVLHEALAPASKTG